MKKIFPFFFITNPEEGRTDVEWASQLTRNQTPPFPQLYMAKTGRSPGYYTSSGFHTHLLKPLKTDITFG